MLIVRMPLVCKDGTKLSVQASEFHYCDPKNSTGPWTAFETGTPMRDDDESVGARITEQEIWEYINKHGGLDLSSLLLSLRTFY